MCLLSFGIAVQMTEETLAILNGPFGQMVDEGLDRFPAGVAQRRGAAVVSGINFYEASVEPMLADQKAETITQTGLTVLVAVAVSVVRNRGRAGGT